MKIQLDYEIKIEVKEGNKIKETLKVFFREFTKSEKKEQDILKKQFLALEKKANKLNRKQVSIGEKIELYKLTKDYDKAVIGIKEREDIEDELEELLEELIALGGGQPDEFVEKSAEKRFNVLVSGKDKDVLQDYAEIKGYAQLMQDLDIAKRELEKKQYGE